MSSSCELSATGRKPCCQIHKSDLKFWLNFDIFTKRKPGNDVGGFEDREENGDSKNMRVFSV